MIVSVAMGLALLPIGPAPDYDRVFGATVGVSNPSVLIDRFGPGAGEVRNFRGVDRAGIEHSRDDGWNWWYWPEANANVQCYWSPAYPKSKRRIVSITICEAFIRDNDNQIHPDAKTAGWLHKIRIGMPMQEALDLRNAAIRNSKSSLNIRRAKGSKFAIQFLAGRLDEITWHAD